MKNFVIVLDVGGTSIKSAVVDSNLNILENTIKTHSAKSDMTSVIILDNLVTIIKDCWKMIGKNNAIIDGISFGFPGPFDYEKGICLIKGLCKFESIYGFNLHDVLKKRLSDTNINFTPDFKILFENDAALFSLGEYYTGETKGFRRVLSLTLGTGMGSTFLIDGRIIKGECGLPESGMIFLEPYKDGKIEDYVSRRGILKLALEYGFDIEKYDVKQLCIFAKEGNENAKKVFLEFGNYIGDALTPYIKKFKPDILLFGGRISNAFDLFYPGLEKYINKNKIKIALSKKLSKSAFIGAAKRIYS